MIDMSEQGKKKSCSIAQAKIEAPIVQATGGFDYQVIKTFTEIAKVFMNNAEKFDACAGYLTYPSVFGGFKQKFLPTLPAYKSFPFTGMS
jgi:hypothetical protein